jgi:hypothetical protein
VLEISPTLPTPLFVVRFKYLLGYSSYYQLILWWNLCLTRLYWISGCGIIKHILIVCGIRFLVQNIDLQGWGVGLLSQVEVREIDPLFKWIWKALIFRLEKAFLSMVFLIHKDSFAIYICGMNSKTTFHLFFECVNTTSIWSYFYSIVGVSKVMMW